MVVGNGNGQVMVRGSICNNHAKHPLKRYIYSICDGTVLAIAIIIPTYTLQESCQTSHYAIFMPIIKRGWGQRDYIWGTLHFALEPKISLM